MGVGNDELTCEFVNPPLSSVIVGPERIGYRAASLLDRIISGHPVPRRPVLIPPLGIKPRRSTDDLKIDNPNVALAVRYIRTNSHRPIQVSDVVNQGSYSRRALE